MKFICRRNGADTGLFTDGRVYEARPIAFGRVFEVTDDGGNVRLISPGPRCPHLVKRWVTKHGPRELEWPHQEPVGAWEHID